MFGLTGQVPDYAVLTIGGNMGVQRMTKEHLGITLALKLPMFVVITKIDIAPAHILQQTLKRITKILKSNAANKMPYLIKTEEDVLTCINSVSAGTVVPIFLVSNVTGAHMDHLKTFLNLLPAKKEWESAKKEVREHGSEQE